MWWFIGLAAASGLQPMVTLEWRGASGQLLLVPPLDVEVAADAPARVRLEYGSQALDWSADGAALEDGLRLGKVRGHAVRGHIEVSLCQKSDGTCTPTVLDVSGQVDDTARGVAMLTVQPGAREAAPEPVAHKAPADDYQTDAAALADAAFEAAAADGRRLLLDFGAVWCPPCNLMAEEVLHADPAPEVLGSYHVVVLDADDPRSFVLKDRYAVGGYPTVVLVKPDGTELSRQVGYPGADEMVAWLEKGAAQEAPDANPAETDPSALTPQEAGDAAWALVQAGHEDVAPWLDRGAEAADHIPFRLARMSAQPSVDDAQWLAAHAPGHAMDWVYGARAALKDTPDGVAAMHAALRADLVGASGSTASDLYYLLAEVSPEEDQPLLFGVAASTLRTVVGDDWDRNRGHLTWLATLTERSGDVDGALALLRLAADRFPTEPTFHLTACGTLLRHERYGDALTWAEEGLARSWGDNKLRMAKHKADALTGLDRRDEAIAVAQAALDEAPDPGDLDVRSDRYRSALQALITPP